jgi:hypothetical protein
MEEILASIRRLTADDAATKKPPPSPAAHAARRSDPEPMEKPTVLFHHDSDIENAMSMREQSQASEIADLNASMAEPSLRRDLNLPPDIFADVLISLKFILGPEEFEVLEHELSAFSEEYRHQHYTACALRIGRTLEHVVYALARSWGVNVNRTTLQVLSALTNSFEQLSKSVIGYAASDETAKTKHRRLVQEQLQSVSGKLVNLVFDLDSPMHPESTNVPVNVESILRDIRKQFAPRNRVRQTGCHHKRRHTSEDPRYSE